MPKIAFICTDLALAFFNSFTSVFLPECEQDYFRLVYCNWHLGRCVIKRVKKSGLAKETQENIINIFFLRLS